MVRALIREVGDSIPLQKVLEEGSGSDWKGRREQIIRLQDTIKQLKEAAAADGTLQAAHATSNNSLAKHEAAHRCACTAAYGFTAVKPINTWYVQVIQ